VFRPIFLEWFSSLLGDGSSCHLASCLLLILFEAALLVGKQGYTCGFFSHVSLFISGIQGITDILASVAI